MKKIKAEKFSIKKWKRSHKKYLKWAERHPVLAWLSPRIHRLPDLPRAIKLSITSFIQRGKRGYASRDTWGFDDYLSEIIFKGLRHLKQYKIGAPMGLTEGQWTDILNTIIDTFESAQKISNGDLVLVKNKKRREEIQISMNRINEIYGANNRCMTTKEIKEYELGWVYFKKYFHNLWD